jgi:hypothetical protein
MTRLLIILFVLLSGWLQAQDSTGIQRPVEQQDELITDGEPYVPDTVLIKSYAKRYNPRKALLYAAILPGLGQAYNKKYWKIPLVYGGFYALGLVLDFNQKWYTTYKKELFYILENNAPKSPMNLTQEQLRPAIDKHRRDRDFFIILMGGMYILQMIDAHVDAHLKEFDLNPQLQVRVRPTMENDMMFGRSTGVSLTIKF